MGGGLRVGTRDQPESLVGGISLRGGGLIVGSPGPTGEPGCKVRVLHEFGCFIIEVDMNLGVHEVDRKLGENCDILGVDFFLP